MADWDTGLFDCFSDIKVCVVTLFCAPCQASYQRAAVEDRECEIMDLICMLFCSICCIVKVRGDIRDKYGIEGSLIMDIITLLCCSICSVTQHTRQLDIKGAKPAGFCMDD
eukprot:TRINITY_DN86_c0_g1_i1.p1 TRINITY_DN86_c0_g1~~TRINITY_DN86_c0_g1_i1.p1  ORF type:complete len:111 (-),score=21.78 TRINITY_DN86_c0_g1_i1:89-421(-)